MPMFLKRCAVLGAAGRIGRQIAARIALEMLHSLQHGLLDGTRVLVLIDNRRAAFPELKRYVRSALFAKVGKSRAYAVERVMDQIDCSTELAAALPCDLVIEALPPNPVMKISALSILHHPQEEERIYFCSHTGCTLSSIDPKGDLNGHLIGWHLISKELVEVTSCGQDAASLLPMAYRVASILGLQVVESGDYPGHLSDGYLIRECAFALHMIMQLKELFGLAGAVYAVEYLTQRYLLRPESIFLTLEKRGWSHCRQIAAFMADVDPVFFSIPFDGVSEQQGQPWIQRNGCGYCLAVYDKAKRGYQMLDSTTQTQVEVLLGPPPSPPTSLTDQGLASYLLALKSHGTVGSELAQAYLENSRLILDALLQSHVAPDEQALKLLFTKGFGYPYLF